MSGAAQRLAAIDTLSATDLCSHAQSTLSGLITILNQETTLLRAGRAREATELSAQKAALAQDYVVLARSVQRQLPRLQSEAPQAVVALRAAHERLAVQMAENLKVIATAQRVTEDLLGDVATAVAAQQRPRTYGMSGEINRGGEGARGISINRSL